MSRVLRSVIRLSRTPGLRVYVDNNTNALPELWLSSVDRDSWYRVDQHRKGWKDWEDRKDRDKKSAFIFKQIKHKYN